MATSKKSSKSAKSSKAMGKAEKEPAVEVRRKCGAMQAHFRLLEEDPGFRARQADLEQSTARRMSLGADSLRAGGPFTIPVVVHVVFNAAAENISMAQIRSQIGVLNRDFQNQNADRSKVPAPFKGLAADANIRFVLAKHDPEGKPTDGVTRTQTTRTSFGANDSVKSSATGGQDPWPTDRYLNIWVCNLGGGLLGYAQFPGGPAETDGVVITHKGFGKVGTAQAPFNLGRTTTHEIGHFLNLRHIWGDTEDCSGTDFVADTPNSAGPNFGKPVFPHVSCRNGPNGDMFMNYMDYVDDAAMFMFSTQQVARMHATLEGARNTLVNP
ncbi:MAG TPA: zinc metalloprotease [Blastocatellia bacterium]|nr:zinc metalloprotease [Blastocatellia bacterium]